MLYSVRSDLFDFFVLIIVFKIIFGIQNREGAPLHPTKHVKLTKTLFNGLTSSYFGQTSKSCWTGVKRTAIASPGSQSLTSLFSNILHESCALVFGTFKRAVPDQFKKCI